MSVPTLLSLSFAFYFYLFFIFFLLNLFFFFFFFVFFQAEDGIRDLVRSRGLGDVYKRQVRSLAGAKLEYPAVALNANGTHTILISQSTRAATGKHWRSTDDGLTWQATGLGESHIVPSPNFAADGTVFALHWWNTGEAGIRRSTDGGVTWAQIGVASLPGAVAWSGLAISPNYATDHTLAAWTRRGDDQGTYLSTDAGQTWVGIAPREYEQYFVAFSPNYAQDHRLWRSKAGSGAHFLVTTDNGQSWQAAGNMPGATVHNLIGAGLQSDSPLWSLTPYGLLSTNPTGGAPTWLLDYSNVSRRPKAPSVLAVSPVFAADGTAVALDSITTEGGQSWRTLSFTAELREARTSAAAFAPDFARSHTMAVAWGVYDRGQFGYFAVSTDGGASWQQHTHCLLYTSDAADERSSVDLGGRRFIKKKKHNNTDDAHQQQAQINIKYIQPTPSQTIPTPSLH